MTNLGPEEIRRRVFIRIVRRHMDESVDVVLRDSLRNSLRAVDMDILVREIPANVQTLFPPYT